MATRLSPAAMAPPLPWFWGRRTTKAPAPSATWAVRSWEPSSATTTGRPASLATRTTWAKVASSL